MVCESVGECSSTRPLAMREQQYRLTRRKHWIRPPSLGGLSRIKYGTGRDFGGSGLTSNASNGWFG